MAAITFRIGDAQQITHELRHGRIVVGRQEPADVVIPVMILSKQHAAITYDESTGEVHVTDLGSSNGTFLLPSTSNSLQSDGTALLRDRTHIWRESDHLYFGQRTAVVATLHLKQRNAAAKHARDATVPSPEHRQSKRQRSPQNVSPTPRRDEWAAAPTAEDSDAKRTKTEASVEEGPPPEQASQSWMSRCEIM